MRPLDPSLLELRGPAVIEASAGTGKTYTITTLVLRLLVESDLSIGQILVVTYTRAATSELRDRIRARLRTALVCARGQAVDDPFVSTLAARSRERGDQHELARKLERALSEVDEAPVLTIHGFCQRVLSEHAFESGSALDVKLTAHAAPLLEEIVDDYYVRELSRAPRETVLALERDEPLKLRSLAVRCAHDPGLRVLPEHIEPVGFDSEAWLMAHARCRAIWHEQRDVVTAMVAGVNAASKRYVPNWAKQWDDLLARVAPGVATNTPAFRNFTTSGIAQKVKRGTDLPEHPFFAAAEELLGHEQAFRERERATRLAFRRRFVGYVTAELSRRTQQDDVRTFDALLTDLDRALSGERAPVLLRALRRQYRAALVDEFQDTDPLQYRVFRRIFAEENAPLLLIGDPKQAIYGFRGADVFAYMAARDDVGERVYTLSVNRRSDAELIQALNALYGQVERPFLLEGIAYHPVSAPEGLPPRFRAREGAPVEVLVTDKASADAQRSDIAARVATEIVALLESGAERFDERHRGGARFRALVPSDIAVLCRTNREARAVQEALSERSVASVFQGDESVFETDDALDIERALFALAHPGDARALRSFLCSIYGGHSAEELAVLERDDARWDEHRATFQRLHETWLEQGTMQALRALVTAYDVERTLLARPFGTRRITNFWQLAELLSEAALDQRLGPLGLLRWLKLVRSDEALRRELSGESHELRLESSDDAVKLTTVHKSKGLEYPVVFLPFTWNPKHVRGEDKTFVRFHDHEARGALTLDLGTDEHDEHLHMAEGEGLSESLRLLYVGLTRAKHRVFLVLPCIKELSESALGYTLLGGARAGEHEKPVGALDAQGLLQELARRAPAGQVRVRMLRPPTEVRLSSRGLRVELTAREPKRVLDERHRTSSFSALTSGARSASSEAGIDHDALADEPREDLRLSPLVLDAFPRGASAGTLIHEVLEHADFRGGDEALGGLVDEVLRNHRYDPALSSVLHKGLSRALSTPLDSTGLCLSHVATEARLNELEFLLPVTAQLTPHKLETLFRDHKAPSALPAYAKSLRALGFDTLTGFLRGFIDLVFAHEERFYVVDYKSNRLGPLAADYTLEPMAQAMAEHHYFLQYHLYAVAVHRYLRMRLRAYDYDRHMGGVYYLFLRGMGPEHELGTGVFYDRPSRALVEALDRALTHEEGRRPR